MANPDDIEGDIKPLEVKVIPTKKDKTPYDSIDTDIDSMFLSNEEIEEFENGS